jgi:hypothetical protein
MPVNCLAAGDPKGPLQGIQASDPRGVAQVSRHLPILISLNAQLQQAPRKFFRRVARTLG